MIPPEGGWVAAGIKLDWVTREAFIAPPVDLLATPSVSGKPSALLDYFAAGFGAPGAFGGGPPTRGP